jgi:hypothetical protein
MVGTRMLLNGKHLRNDYSLEGWRNSLDRLDLQASHR